MNAQRWKRAIAGSIASGLLVLGGCDPVRFDAKSAHDHGGGRARIYEATYEQTWAAAHAAVSWSRAGAVEDHADERYLITDDHHFDQIGIWFTHLGPEKTQATVVVMDDRRTGPNEQSVLDDIGVAVDRIRAGQPVDKRP